MNPLAIIQPNDLGEYTRLPTIVKREVDFWSKVVQRIDSSKNKTRAIRETAALYDRVRGVSHSTVRRKYYDWKRDGWLTLVNVSKTPKHLLPKALLKEAQVVGQSPVFIEYWKGLQESYQRNSKAAYRELLRRYRCNDEQIPGIGNWRNVWVDTYGTRAPDQCPLDAPLPEGWNGNGRQLMRYKPTKFELAVSRQGRSAAAKFRPLVHTTRVGMAAGQCYVFDDVQHDNVVTMLGQVEAMRPLEFCALDYFSGCQIAWGAQPMIRDMESGKKKMLEEKEMRFLLAHVLCNVGYHPDGCQLHMEHGSATVRKDLAELLFSVSNEKLTVLKGGIDRRPAHDGYFLCRPKGNSRFKAALESHHNLKHNELAALPGQTGKDRAHSPESLHGLLKYNEDLLKVAAQYPQIAELLIYPSLEFNQWKQAANQIYYHINNRIDHNLEGWLESGLVLNRFELVEGGGEIPMSRLLEMDPQQQEAVKAVMRPLPPRRLSPLEVFGASMKRLVKLPQHMAMLIIGEEHAEPKRLTERGLFELENLRLGPGIHRYLGTAIDAHGMRVKLEPGKEYLVYLSPFWPEGLLVADIRGGFIGACERWDKICRTDLDGIHRQIGKAEHIHEQLLAPVKLRHTQEANARKEMIEQNNRTLVQAGIRPKVGKKKPAVVRDSGVDLISHYNG